jgi:2-desacetyl-2-hydroxyethyl bacteriochlorophyllide A dehydrogenase
MGFLAVHFMKAWTLKEPGKFACEERPIPDCPPGGAVIRIRRIGICGTDLHAFEGSQPYFNYPRVLGHELSGELVACRDAQDFSVGEAVTCLPYFSCGKCQACRSGKPNYCVRLEVCGVHRDGGMAEYISWPAEYLVDGEGLSYDALALVEPFSIGAHGVARAGVTPGENVLVVGAGPIGLAAIEFARIAGAHVIVMDVNPWRLASCREKWGVEDTFCPGNHKEACGYLSQVTGGSMAEVVIDATGNRQAIHEGFDYLAFGGRYILIGIQKEDVSFSHPDFHQREGTLMSSRNATRADFMRVMAALKAGQIDPEKYITDRIPFPAIQEAFVQGLEPTRKSVKIMITL